MKKILLFLFIFALLPCECFAQEATSKIIILRPVEIFAKGTAKEKFKNYTCEHYIDIDNLFLANIATLQYYEVQITPGTHTIVGYTGFKGQDSARIMGPSYSLIVNAEEGKTHYVSIDDTKMTLNLINEKQWNKIRNSIAPVKWTALYTLKDGALYEKTNGKQQVTNSSAFSSASMIVTGKMSTSTHNLNSDTQTQQVGSTTAPQISAITITTPFAEVSASSVLAIYKNEFGKYEMPEKDETFPYVAIRVKLQGTPNLIRLAKQNLTLNLGQMFQTEQTVTSYDNMILFLIPAGAKNIYLTCGDGCERQMIYSGSLQANRIYDGTIQVQ